MSLVLTSNFTFRYKEHISKVCLTSNERTEICFWISPIFSQSTIAYLIYCFSIYKGRSFDQFFQYQIECDLYKNGFLGL
jgi:hypothetical protein